MWDSHHLPLAVNILGKLYFSYSLIFNLNVCVSLRLISPVDSGCKSKSSSTGAEQIGAGLATALVMPHMAFVWLALIFNWLGYFLKLRWAALVAGILYAVAMLAFFIYFMFVIVEMILCFVAFAKMGKKHEEAI